MLVVGLGLLGAETCKNLVLAGVGSVTLADPDTVHSTGHFLISDKDTGKNVSACPAKRVCSMLTVCLAVPASLQRRVRKRCMP